MGPPNTCFREFTRETPVDAVIILFHHVLIEIRLRKEDGRREPTKNTPPQKKVTCPLKRTIEFQTIFKPLNFRAFLKFFGGVTCLPCFYVTLCDLRNRHLGILCIEEIGYSKHGGRIGFVFSPSLKMSSIF